MKWNLFPTLRGYRRENLGKDVFSGVLIAALSIPISMGYAQIAGKYNTLPKDKMLLDLMYIENYSLWEDIKLVFKTATVFYRGDSTEAFHEPNAANDGAANTGAAKSDSSVKNDASRAG